MSKKRYKKGTETLARQIETHRDVKLRHAIDEDNIELAGYYEKEISRLEEQLAKKQEKMMPEKEKAAVSKRTSFNKWVDNAKMPYSSQKTSFLFKKGMNVEQIAKQRGIKEGTVWEHLATLIEYNQLSLWNVLPKEKIERIRKCIEKENDSLKEIKQRVKDNTITYDEINCILSRVKCMNKRTSAQKKKAA